MLRVVGASLGLLALVAPAFAADMPVKAGPVFAPKFTWTGCYGGVYGGGAATQTDVIVTDLDGYNVAPHSFGYRMDHSIIAGGTLGCNYQSGLVVWGIEGEAGYMSMRGSAADPLGLDTLASSRIGDWYGMVAGRLGWAFDNVLFYIKGGVAFTEAAVSIVDANPVGLLINTSASRSFATWTLGAGIEHHLRGPWTVKGEYMYIDTLQTLQTCGVVVGGPSFCWNHELPDTHTVKVGLNYYFGKR